jgi:hypothetical protein
LMHPLRWDLIALAWGYALIWILLLDQLKLIAYQRLEQHVPANAQRQGA